MDQGPNEIEREMAAIRAALAHDAHAAAADARTLTDWKHHFRAHPWLFCGCAAAAGYLLAPGRAKSTQDIAQAPISRYAATGGGPPADSSPAAAAQGVVTAVLGMLAGQVARQALRYAMDEGLKFMRQARAGGAQEGAPEIANREPLP